MFGQNKYPPDNPGDCLLACQAATIGRMYYDNPKLNFQNTLDLLRQTPEKNGTAINDLFWNTAIKCATEYLIESKDLK